MPGKEGTWGTPTFFQALCLPCKNAHLEMGWGQGLGLGQGQADLLLTVVEDTHIAPGPLMVLGCGVTDPQWLLYFGTGGARESRNTETSSCRHLPFCMGLSSVPCVLRISILASSENLWGPSCRCTLGPDQRGKASSQESSPSAETLENSSSAV